MRFLYFLLNKALRPATVYFIFALLLSCSKEEDPKVTANEDLYMNEVYASSGDDWIELFNNASADKDISGYRIYDNADSKYTLPSGTLISAKGFLVIFCDDGNNALHTNFKLSSAGETVYLENAAGEVIDKIGFPELADGQSYGRYPDGSVNFKISGNTTQGTTNGDAEAPVIKKVSRTPLVPGLNDNVNVLAELQTTTGITSVKLYYRVNNGSFSSLDMALNGVAYTATIPALNTTGQVDYYVETTGSGGKKSFDPFDAPLKTYHYLLNTDPLPQLLINEFMAFNTSCCPDTDGGLQEFDDWIEIYNAGATVVDIGGMYLSDDLTNPFNSRIPQTNTAKTTIQPGGFIVLWADGSRSQGELHLDFGLSNAGEAVGLYYKDGRTIDTYTFGAQNQNVSLGRTTNGGATWKVFTAPTPGQSNQ